MPTFKVTLLINDGLTLGHVLQTKGVEVLHIVEEQFNPKQVEKRFLTDKKISVVNDGIGANGKPVHFKHPSGKTLIDFVFEYMQGKDRVTWAELRRLAISLGFSQSSINNAISRLISNSKIKKVDQGMYSII
jgi:hypothetical protein